MKYRKIGLYCNRRKPQALALAKAIYPRLQELGAEPIFTREVEEYFGLPGQAVDRVELCARSEALIVFGGDGTLIWAARDSYPYEIPILGVSQGYLGFLSETTPDLLDEQLQLLVKGKFTCSDRLALWVKVFRQSRENVAFQSPVINDLHVYRRAKGRILRLQTLINHEVVTQYRADGILISTPTGSTGHSLSAGGPILKPQMRAILVTPICPHTLASRSLVIDEKDEVEVRIQPEDTDVSLTVDGQIDVEVAGGDIIHVHRGKHPINFIEPGRRSFYEVLRQKLYLGETSAISSGETLSGDPPL